MCGILCCISPLRPVHRNNDLSNPESRNSASCPFCVYHDNHGPKDSTAEIALTDQFLRNRGPNTSHEECFTAAANSLQVHLSGHVLWTQGPRPISQPIVSASKFFLFNGDIYSFGPHSTHSSSDIHPSVHSNDGQHLFELLASCSPVNQAAHFINTIGSLQGPFAFIFYDSQQDQLWFGRDFFGRQSLLISTTKKSDGKHSIIFSSVSAFPNALEIPTSGLFCYNLEKNEITSYLWKCHERKQVCECAVKFQDYLQTVGIGFNVDRTKHVEIAGGLTTKLKPPISSGADSNSVENKVMHVTSDDLLQALHQVTELLSDKIEQLLVHLRRSVKRRILTMPPYCKRCIEIRESGCSHSKIGILFSGGLDSMVLAYLAAEVLATSTDHSQDETKPSIDLINVAFFQDEHHANLSLDTSLLSGNHKTKIPIPPDRITGREAHAILHHIFEPRGVNLNFIEVNVPRSRVSSLRETKLRHLISPLTSVLDDSLGCCLWFAAEATSNGLSDARILLLGSGADELFGGYGRHRSAYESKGWNGLMDEMQLEIDRISVRNMGRDNRVVSDHGVSPRLPFLDENVVRFVTEECDLWKKCCPLKALTNTNGTDNCFSLGDKILLRATAMKLLRSQNCDGIHLALFPKRAMQFGSRIAKLENSKEKGGDECKRLIHI